jgi:hypothetical protein
VLDAHNFKEYMMRTSMLCSLFLCLGIFLVAGCGGDTGAGLAKDYETAMKEQIDEIKAAGADAAKVKAAQDKFKPKLDALKARGDKLSDAEKKIFTEKMLAATPKT